MDHADTPTGAVLFDMDGTLTRPVFDFDAIRREIGLPTSPRTPILESMARMTPAERARAEDILTRAEREVAENSVLWDDALPVLATLRGIGWATAVITRNSRASLDTLMARHGLRFDAVGTRDDGPIKPAAESVLRLCSRVNVPPHATWVVGDYLFDLQAGNSAGATTVLMVGDAPVPDYASQADHVIRRLSELLPLLKARPYA